MSYERKNPDAKPKEDFWAVIERPDDRFPPEAERYMIVRSPVFEYQGELTSWLGKNLRPGDEVESWRRELSDGGFKNISLGADDEIRPDPARLAAILEEARATLDAGRKKMRPMGRQHVTDRERGLEARQRLENAGAALKPPTVEEAQS